MWGRGCLGVGRGGACVLLTACNISVYNPWNAVYWVVSCFPSYLSSSIVLLFAFPLSPCYDEEATQVSAKDRYVAFSVCLFDGFKNKQYRFVLLALPVAQCLQFMLEVEDDPDWLTVDVINEDEDLEG